MIKQGDWVLVCEMNERGCVIEVFDEGERLLVNLPQTDAWPFPRRVCVMIEKVRKIRTPKPEKPKKWEQQGLF